jgi:hypothetical protein
MSVLEVSLQEFTLILSFLKRKREGDFANVSDRWSCKKFAKRLWNVQERWTLRIVKSVQDKRSETFAKSPSRLRFKNERISVNSWKETRTLISTVSFGTNSVKLSRFKTQELLQSSLSLTEHFRKILWIRTQTIFKQNSSSSQLDLILIPSCRRLISGILLRFGKVRKISGIPGRWNSRTIRERSSKQVMNDHNYTLLRA